MIQVGDKIPAVNVTVAGAEHQSVNAAELFANKKIVLFALPGAYTPTCSAAHLPGYVLHADDFKAKVQKTLLCPVCFGTPLVQP